MKKYNNHIKYLLCLLLASPLAAQSDNFAIISDVFAALPTGSIFETAKDAIFLPEGGRIAVAGITKVSENNQDGFLLLYDPQTGHLERGKPFSQTQQDAYQCIARADNGHLYAAGHTLDGKGSQKSLLVQYAEWPNFLKDPFLFGAEGSSIQKMAWLHDDRGLLAGRNHTGSVWLSVVAGEEAPESQQLVIGGGKIKNIAGLIADPVQKSVWLFGNTLKLKDSKGGNAWIAQLDAELGLNTWQPIETEPEEVVTQGTLGHQGELFMVGHTNGTNNGSKQGWITEIGPDLTVKNPILFGTEQPDTATAICQLADESLMAAFSSLPLGGIRPKSANSLWQKNGSLELQRIFIKKGEDLEVLRIFQMNETQFLLVCNSNTPNPNQRGVRFIQIKKIESLQRERGARGGLPGTSDAEIKACRIKSKNGGTCAAPGETITLYCSIQNKSTQPLLMCRLNVQPSDGSPAKTLTLDRIEAGQTREFSTGIAVQANAVNGLSFNLTLTDATQKALHDYAFAIGICPPGVVTAKGETGIPATIAPILIPGQSPQSPTNRGQSEFDFNIVTPEPVLPGDIKVAVKGKKKTNDGRSRQILLDSSIPSGDKNPHYVTKIRCNIDLDTGSNDIAILYRDKPLHYVYNVEYKPGKPDLHIFAIGPRYQPPYELQYVENDIREFTRAMQAQSGGNWYDTVYVKTLMPPAQTDKRSIELFMDSLPQYRTIKDNDYVVLYMAGHGSLWKNRRGEINQDFCFWPSGYIPGKDEVTGFNYNDWVSNVLDSLKCKKLIFIDACHSGAGRGNADQKSANEALLKANAILKGTATFYSCKPEQQSQENKDWQHGAFTKALLEALAGKEIILSDKKTKIDPDGGYPDPANTKNWKGLHDGLITVYELQQFLAKRVPDLVKAQYGDSTSQVPDFTVKPDLTDDTVIFSIPDQK
jgi:hypothetical protein